MGGWGERQGTRRESLVIGRFVDYMTDDVISQAADRHV